MKIFIPFSKPYTTRVYEFLLLSYEGYNLPMIQISYLLKKNYSIIELCNLRICEVCAISSVFYISTFKHL